MKVLAVGVAATTLLLGGCQEEKEPPAPVRPVLFTTVEPQTVERLGPFASSVEARYQSQLGFQVAGRMVARDVYVGQVVHIGQRLAALDPTVVQFSLTRAKADFADATAQFTNAAGIEQRQRALFARANTAKAVLDNAVAGRDTARARLEQARTALQIAQDQLSYTRLVATFDGVVSAWNAEVGQYVANGQAVVTVARPDVREVVVDIPDALIGQIRPGLGFVVRLLAAPEATALGTVREIGPLADTATRSHRVRLALKEPPPSFRLGTTVTAAVERSIAARVTLPETAVMETDGRASVWVVASDGRSVKRRNVTVAERRDGEAVITAGLSKGDRVVTAGVHSLRDDQPVKVATTARDP